MIFETIIVSLFSIFVLLVMTRLMGYRQISQMSLYDYIIGITIGSICGDFAIAPLDQITVPLVAILVYSIVTIMISKITQKNTLARSLIEGHPFLLFYHQEFNYKNFNTAKIEISEFLRDCRTQGYFDMKDIYMAILETNGKISILPNSKKRPVNPEDLNISVNQDPYIYHLVIDKKINKKNLQLIHKDQKWLEAQLSVQGASVETTLLATYSNNDQLTVYKINDQ